MLALIREREVKAVDLRFMDFPGLWQHTTCPISELTLDTFDHGNQVERRCQADDALDEGHTRRIVRQALHEGPVNLQQVDGQLGQQAQG